MEKSLKRKKILKTTLLSLLVIGLIVTIVCVTLLYTTNVYVTDFIEVPRYEINKADTHIVDKTDSYLGHPDLVLTDSGKLITVYPSGHGKGPIIMKTSDDLGVTWSDRLTGTPENWKYSQETPILYKINYNGKNRIILTSGCPKWPNDKSYKENGFNCSISNDDGKTFTEFTNWYGIDWANKNNKKPFDAIVAMSSLTQLKNENGEYIGKWMGTFHDHDFYNYRTYLTFDENENPVWSEPELLLPNYHKEEKKYNICELEIIRDPSTDTLILIGRVNKKNARSLVFFSDDEGNSWSQPKELPYSLTGERHKAEYDPITGDLVISFRQVLPHKPNAVSTQKFIGNQWVAWVGTFDDIMSYKDNDTSNDKVGKCQIILGTNNANSVADNGYCGIIFTDGKFILTSYGYFDDTTKVPFIMCARFKVSDYVK